MERAEDRESLTRELAMFHQEQAAEDYRNADLHRYLGERQPARAYQLWAAEASRIARKLLRIVPE